MLEATGLIAAEAFSADFINQVYDHTRDAIFLAPSSPSPCRRGLPSL